MTPDAREAANAILKAIVGSELDTLATFFNEVNRRKFLPLTDVSRQRMQKALEKGKRLIGDVRAVKEIREGPSYMGPGSVIAQLREEGPKMYVIALQREGDKYVFEDVTGPAVKHFFEAKLLSAAP